MLDPELPAPALFSNPEVLSKQVTLLYYAEEVGLPLSEFKLVPVTERASVPAEELPSVEEILVAERHDGTVPRLRLSSNR